MKQQDPGLHGRLSGYDLLMRETAVSSVMTSEDFLCEGCEYHRPDWEYRFCLNTECLHVKGQLTFREEYLEEKEEEDFE